MAEQSNNGMIVTFTVVIVSLATIFTVMITGLGAQSELSNAHQEAQAELRDGFQIERLAIYTQAFDAKMVEMDIKLQQEISAEAALRDRRFSQAESDSANRHDAQQAQIDEMKGWFKPPALIDNDTN